MEYEGKVMISELQSYFKFEQLSGNEESLNRWVIVPDVNRPGLELAGFYKHTEPRGSSSSAIKNKRISTRSPWKSSESVLNS